MTGFVIPPGGPPGFLGPTIDDPGLLNDVLQTFRIREALQPFALSRVAVPVIDIGKVSALAGDTVVTTTQGSQGVRVGVAGTTSALGVVPPQVSDADVVDATATNPSAGQVIADTGALSTTNRFYCAGLIGNTAGISDFDIQWRNAANSATLATWHFLAGTGQPQVYWGPFVLGLSDQQRIRIVNVTAVTGKVCATIQASRVFQSVAA